MSPVDPIAFAPAAFLAGVFMFLAPCTLPIVPGYLAFVAGVPAGNSLTDSLRRRIRLNALAFIVGFSLVFIFLGLFAGFVGSVIGPWRYALARGAGAVVVLFGLTMLGVVRVSVLTGEHRLRVPKSLTLGRWESSLLIGALFALGWSPCIGPILGTVLLFASTSATALQGAFLLAVFSLGLGIPFFLTALLIEQVGGVITRWSKTVHTLSVIGGVVLVILGVLMLLGMMDLLVSWGYGLFDGLGYSRLLQYM